MKILHVNTYDISGGAAKAVNRLHKGLEKVGVESYMFVQKKQTNDEKIYPLQTNIIFKGIESLRTKLDFLPKLFYRDREDITWSVNWLHNPLFFYYIKKIKPDVINLHWINNGFISIKQLNKLSKLKIPIVWTLHDMWSFTGGCHYPGDCKKYQSHCNSCPQLNSSKKEDLSHKIFKQKGNYYPNINIVATSEWMRENAERSKLFNKSKKYLIPIGLNTEIFKPRDKVACRKEFNLPLDKEIILFGAAEVNDERKGLKYLINAFKKMKKSDYVVAIFGNSKIETKLPFETYYLGRIEGEENMSKLYNAATIFVGPSIEEAFGQTFLEAIVCGIPAVAFDYGGPKDIIDHKKTGYLAKYKDVEDLAKGIEWAVKNKPKRANVSVEYSLETQARRYKELYESLILKK